MYVVIAVPITYSEAPDVKKLADEIAEKLGFFHIVPQFVFCIRSKGSASRRTIARIHGLGKVWQETLNLPSAYVIEVISERYDRLDARQQREDHHTRAASHSSYVRGRFPSPQRLH